MAITFNGFNLNDGQNYISTAIPGGRGTAPRGIISNEVAFREGVKFLSEEYREKIITVIGTVYADDITTFREKVDDLKQELSYVQGQLVIDETGRYYTATAGEVDISDEGAEITAAKFSVELRCELPFALAASQSVNFVVTSGVNTLSSSVTITGTAPARPTITFNIPDGDGIGRTTISGITITHTPTGNYITWSGTGTSRPLIYSGEVNFNYNNNSVIVRGAEEDFAGLFSLWEPGANAFTFSISGMSVGGSLDFIYNPRYY